MTSRVATVAFQGIEAVAVDVQAQFLSGQVQFHIVGLPDKAVAESRERVRAALYAIGLGLPGKRLAILTNGGEYGLSVQGHHEKVWERDPKVMAAKGDRDWYEYISERKAHQETIITQRLQALVPERRLYVYYFTDGSSHRMRYGGWKLWEWDYEDMAPISDMPNSSIYFRHYNDGWSGKYDMLTMALNSVGGHRALGQDLSYNWMSPGWPGEGRPDPAMSDPEHYTGYLKCYYTAGMIGGVAGYFSYEPVEQWVWQLMALGRVQALFSHLDEFLRESDLLPGPSMHAWSTDQPAYELPTGDPDARVLCRKHREREEWLLCAWAAAAGLLMSVMRKRSAPSLSRM